MNLQHYSANWDKSWNKDLNRNDILTVKFGRLLTSETRASDGDKYKFLKERINNLKYESTEAIEKKNSMH